MNNNLENIVFNYDEPLSKGDLENLKSILIECYKQIQSRKNRYVFTPKEATPKIWDNAAKLCEEYKLKPYRFVELCYENCEARKSIMRSFMLTGSVMRKLCEDEAKLDKELTTMSLEDYVNSSIKFAAELIKLNSDDPCFVLKSPGYAIEPWVRICLCNNNETVIKRYKEKADQQVKNIKGLYEYINTKTNLEYKYD